MLVIKNKKIFISFLVLLLIGLFFGLSKDLYAEEACPNAGPNIGDCPGCPSGDPGSAPAGPVLSAINASCSRINLSWTDVAYEQQYYVQHTLAGGTWTTIATLPAGATTYSHAGVSAGVRHYYRIIVGVANGAPGFSNEASAVPPSCSPLAPSGLTATVVSCSQINLSWTDNSNNETGFRIQKSFSNTYPQWIEHDEVGENVESYSHTGLSENTGYYYRVYAYNNTGPSAVSDSAGKITPGCPIFPPTVDIKASGQDALTIGYNGSATLTWTSIYTNNSSCTGDWPPTGKTPNGSSSTGNLTSSRTYTITCTNNDGTAVDSVTVSVNLPSDDPPEVDEPGGGGGGSGNPRVIEGDYCTIPAHYFSWDYYDPDGDDQIRYQFQVDNNSDFSSPEVNRDYADLSNSSPTTINQTVLVVESAGSERIVYGTTYYWRVKVYSQSLDSGWVFGPSFGTATHRYPTIDFSWSPSNPSEDEDVQFTDESTVYGGTIKSAWNWIFENGDPGSSNDQNPVVKFTSQGDNAVTLSVTDSDNYTCPSPMTVSVQEPLPWWEEIWPW